MNQPSDTLSARDAADLLGVKLATLYAYVSRGQLESVPGEGRARRYRRSDLDRLQRRKAARRGEDLSSDALRWGAPVLDSTITEVTPAGPLYRGESAVRLARAHTPFEAVAELLWQGALPDEAPRWRSEVDVPAGKLAALVPKNAPPLTLLAALVPLLAARDPARFDRRPEAVLPRARGIIRRLAEAQAVSEAARKKARRASTVAEALAAALRARGGSAAVRAIDQALTLWADHELNVSAFAARVAASAEADVYACVSAGLAALSGPQHGAACERIEALVREAARPERAEQVVLARAARGEAVPGFGHPLYPAGDPRALPILESALALAPRSLRVRTGQAVIDAVAASSGLAPTVDTALVLLAAALGLPEGAAPGLIAVGRCAGWVAHVLEQYAAGFMIRPRARYAGG